MQTSICNLGCTKFEWFHFKFLNKLFTNNKRKFSMNHPPPLKKNYQGNTTKKPESTGKIFTFYIIQCSWSIHQRCNIRIKLNFFDESFWRFNIHFLKVDLLWTSWKTIFYLTEKLLIVLDTVKDKCRHNWLARNSLRRCQYCHSCVERTSIPRPSQDQVNFWKNV